MHAAYPGPTWGRLAAVKARYDPTNLFRLNQNVPAPNWWDFERRQFPVASFQFKVAASICCQARASSSPSFELITGN